MEKNIVETAEQKVKAAKEKAREEIKKAIKQNGPYSHNLIGLSLSFLASDVGVDAANELVEEFSLTRLYGIHKSKEGPAQVIPQVVKAPEPPRKTHDDYEREKKQKLEKERNQKYKNLFTEIDKLAPGVFKFNNDRIEAVSKRFKDVYVRVLLENPWVGWHRSDNHYIRLETSDWDVKFKKNWTFETKDIVLKVTEKAKQLLTELEGRKEYKNEQADKHERAAVYLKKEYGITDAGRNYSNSTGRLDMGEYVFVNFAFDIDDLSYKIDGLPTLTEEQFKAIVQVVKEKRNV